MAGDTRILLIDDNERSRHDLEIVLSFLGETTVSANSSNWQECASKAVEKSSDIYVALIGSSELLPLHELLADIYRWEAGTP